MFGTTTDEDLKAQTDLLERAFRSPLNGAVLRELGRLRRNKVSGEAQFKSLVDIYHQHGLRDRTQIGQSSDVPSLQKVICSEVLL